jgi:hypothetical protein
MLLKKSVAGLAEDSSCPREVLAPLASRAVLLFPGVEESAVGI